MKLYQLMGHDRFTRGIAEAAWRDFIEYVAETMDVGPGTRVFQVNCGAGSFLFPLWENGYVVGGLDPSDLIRLAAEAMPEGRFSMGEASALDPAEPWDVVVACGTFGSFHDLDYARGVLARMAAKATHAIAVLDVPDIDRLEGSPMSGLFYDRTWIFKMLAEIGATAVQIEEQKIEGYPLAPYRFNVFARL
jgi:hypothetical protein